ncbi:hydroxymethylbilane synthase [Sphingomonas sp. BIUV-7]|uniref:Porphobilinogen deaminase n=1 Tax=Sphingomonas natans TaxID=3063330 RepID=A0ABT8YCZ1_9SPHN|nr:hydroxymethylbilane synthase [Sphingomonas sp. BIUV-7]MDO6416200.1 hydroxymethylbilane synthase [Sphingomonas sp. BIUV-7]
MTAFRLGTRGSPLALVQAEIVRDGLVAAHGIAVEIRVIKTTGDVVQDRPLAEVGGKALWTKELDRALLEGEIECAVHSMKDVETTRPPVITIAAILARADFRDRLIGAASIADLPAGATVGTSSPRRSAQLLRLRPDLTIIPFRGNVETRLAKLAAGEAEATLLAAAGLDRLGRPEVGMAIPIDLMLPAPAQGAIGVETRENDSRSRSLLAVLNHGPTRRSILTERALLAALGADCHSPVAALADDVGMLHAELFSVDGSAHVAGSHTDPHILANDLLDRAPTSIRSLFVRARSADSTIKS